MIILHLYIRGKISKMSEKDKSQTDENTKQKVVKGKVKLFCEFYVYEFGCKYQLKAAVKAGYSKKSANKISEYLNPFYKQHQYIRDYIEKLKQEIKEKSSLSKKDILAELEKRIELDISDLFEIKEIIEKNDDGSIKRISQSLVIDLKTYKKWKEKGYTRYLNSISQDKSGHIKIDLIGLMDALDMLNRMQGNYAAQKVELGAGGIFTALYEDRENRINLKKEN